MSAAYGGYYPSPSYAYPHANSWRPSDPASTYDRSHQYPIRRGTPSPSRCYRPYDGHSAQNNYRPTYRSDEDAGYYNRSPTPDRYGTRVDEPDAWDRSTQWNLPAKPSAWQDAPPSPKSAMGRQRSDSMLATRIFEPSASWKQTHIERPAYPDSPRAHTEYHSNSASPQRLERPTPVGGDRYRPPLSYASGRSEYDSYRPEWSPPHARRRSPNRSSAPYDYTNRRVSAAGSIDSSVSSRRRSPHYHSHQVRSRSRSRRSFSRGRHSRSRSSSRGRRPSTRGRRSSNRNHSRSRSPRSRSRDGHSRSRGRRFRSRDRRSRSRSYWSRSRSRSPSSKSFQGNRHRSQASGTKFNGKASLSPKGRYQKRSASRSSIASTRRSPSPHPDVIQPLETKEESQTIANGDVTGSPATNGDVEMVSPVAELAITRSAVVVHHSSPGQHQPPVQGADAMLTEDDPLKPLPSIPSPKAHPILQSSTPSVQTNGVETACSDNLPPNETLPSPTSLQPTLEAPPSPMEPPRPGPLPQHPVTNEVAATHSSPQARQLLDGFPPRRDIMPRPAENGPSSERLCGSLPTPVPTPKPPQVSSAPPPLRPLPEEVSDRSEAKSRAELLRTVVMSRMLCDRQTREDRVDPILRTNLALASLIRDARSSSAPQVLSKEVTEGAHSRTGPGGFNRVQGCLVDRFRERQIVLTEKTKRLKKEYLALHERWATRCAQLDAQCKPPTMEAEPLHQASGRATRRSMANLGDVVRSDLEMEQILANLGNDDATDPSHLSLRNLANIPDMISVTDGKVDYQFDDTNHLVKNPVEYYGPRTGTHDWTNAEKGIFLDKFAAHPKQFGLIAEYIPNKTAAQCVDYYYLHKKTLIDFRKVVSQYAPNKRRRRGTGKKRGNGLLADIRQHDAEVHRDTNLLSTAGRASRGKRTSMVPPESKEAKKNANSSRRRWVPNVEGTISLGSETPTPEPETRPRRRRFIVTPTSQTVSTSLEDAEEDNTEEIERPAKRAKRTRRIKSAAIVAEEPTTPEPGGAIEQNGTAAGRRKPQSSNVLWSDDDQKVFLALLAQYGDDFKRIAASMPNKTTVQVSNYYKANVTELSLEQVAASAPKRSPTPDPKERSSSTPHTASTRQPETSAPLSVVIPQHNSETNSLYPNHELHTRPLLPTVPPVNSSSQMHNYAAMAYPPQNGRPGLPYVSGTPLSLSSYPTHQAVPYTYTTYAEPLYSPYDPRLTPLPPISLIDPLHGTRMMPSVSSVRSRENPYPLVSSQPQQSYPYSLESS